MPVLGVDLGDEISLLDEATEKVVSYMTSDGRIHLVAIIAKGEAYYIVVSERGVEREETFGGDDHSTVITTTWRSPTMVWGGCTLPSKTSTGF